METAVDIIQTLSESLLEKGAVLYNISCIVQFYEEPYNTEILYKKYFNLLPNKKILNTCIY